MNLRVGTASSPELSCTLERGSDWTTDGPVRNEAASSEDDDSAPVWLLFEPASDEFESRSESQCRKVDVSSNRSAKTTTVSANMSPMKCQNQPRRAATAAPSRIPGAAQFESFRFGCFGADLNFRGLQTETGPTSPTNVNQLLKR